MEKLKLTVFVFFILFSSCKKEAKGGFIVCKKGDYVIKVIDSCEYIEYNNGIYDQRVYSLTHKGNCKFCLEKNK